MNVPASPSDDSPPRILPTLVLWGVGLLIVITVAGWVIGAILSVLRLALLVAIVAAVIWALVAGRGDR